MKTVDEEHLKLLSIFHYVVAGITALFSMFPILHLVVGIVMLNEPKQGGVNGPPAAFAIMFIIMALTFICLGLACALCIFLAGRFLSQRKNRVFCMVVAGLSCVMFPFGTALGVFSLIVLCRDSVRELFDSKAV